MGEWPQFIQSVLIGVIFSFLLAKLFSVIFAFREDNLRITRADPDELPESESKSSQVKPEIAGSKSRVLEEREPLISNKAVVEEENNAAPVNESSSSSKDAAAVPGGYSSGSDSDWEGVESTELDEAFSAATAFVAATAADRSTSLKVSNEVQLQLYGLYKIATEGPCSTPQPSPLKNDCSCQVASMAKIRHYAPEDAMEKYINIVTELYPSWAAGADTKKQGKETRDAVTADSKGPMGPVFSTFIYEDEPGNDLKLDAMHAFAREGDKENLLKCIESGVPIDIKDSEGRTALHWAVDRGHLSITELLLSKSADVNAKDNEGQTPLHYAAVCERAAIAEFLVNHKADIEIKDDDGNSPGDLCELNWPWLPCVASVTD